MQLEGWENLGGYGKGGGVLRKPWGVVGSQGTAVLGKEAWCSRWACWPQGQTWPGQGFPGLASGPVGPLEWVGKQGQGLNNQSWKIWKTLDLEMDLLCLCEQDKGARAAWWTSDVTVQFQGRASEMAMRGGDTGEMKSTMQGPNAPGEREVLPRW